MAKKNEFKKQDESLNEVNEAVSSASAWIENNSKMLTSVIGAIIIIIGVAVALNVYVFKPKGIEASNENAKAVAYFSAGEWEKALKGDEADCIGFEEVARQYKFYQEGKLAALYAGICQYQLGNYEEATTLLKKFSADDLTIDPASKQLLGDAYVQMGELKKATVAFRSAADSKNEIIAPMSLKKAGLVYLELDDKKSALKVFEMIKDDYPTSSEAMDIDKYIALAQ